MFKCDGDRLFVCLWCSWCVSISAITALTDMIISGKLNWMDVATSVMVQLEVLCQYLTEVTQRVSSGNNGRMNGRKLLKENIHNIFFHLTGICLLFVSCVYIFMQWFINSVNCQYLFLSLFFNFPFAIMSNMLITSNLLYCLAFCSVWINYISYIMGYDHECGILLLWLLFCSFVVLVVAADPFCCTYVYWIS